MRAGRITTFPLLAVLLVATVLTGGVRTSGASAPSVPVIVRTDGPATALLIATLQAAVGGFDVGHHFTIIPGFSTTLSPGQLAALRSLPGVKAVQPDAPVHAAIDTATRESGIDAAVADFGVTGDRDGNEHRYSKKDVVIAIIDTGIDRDHDALDGRKVVGGLNLVRPTESCPGPSSSARDDHGHGTHVASIAAGNWTDNSYDGVAPGAALVDLKALDCKGNGRFSNIEEAIEETIEDKTSRSPAWDVDVLNLSLGGRRNSDGRDSTSRLLNMAVANGIEVVVAAGNLGPRAGTVAAPGTARFVLTVGAVADPLSDDGRSKPGFSLASFSGRGPTDDGRVKPDLIAPGVDIKGAYRNTYTGKGLMSGTSMAAPFVAGVAALMLDAGARPPSGSECSRCAHGVKTSTMRDPIKRRLRNTAVPWGPRGADNETGKGRVDVHRALQAYSAASSNGPPPVPAHRARVECLRGEGRRDVWGARVTTTRWPFALTMIHKSGTGRDPNFDVRVFDPQGRRVGVAASRQRQESVGFQPKRTGRYKIRITSREGGGRYFLDTSGPREVFRLADDPC